MITNEIIKALGYLFIAGVVSFAYNIARENSKGGKLMKALWEGILCCGGLALIVSMTLGRPTCVEQSDPMSGSCAEYADNGYEPTTEQRAASFAYFMTLLYMPVILGAFRGKDE